jgi:hypothetical protein
MNPDVQTGREKISQLEKFSPEQQAAVLASPHAMRILAYEGAASKALALVEKFSPGQQTDVLAVPDAVFGLAYNGAASKALALIEKLSPGQQAAVLAAPDAVAGLANNGQEKAMEKILRGVKPDPEHIDEENPEWTREDMAKARPASEVLPGLIGQKATDELMRRGQGKSAKKIRPRKKTPR